MAQKEDPANIIGDAASFMAGASETPMEGMMEKRISTSEAAKAITDAVNPVPKQMGSYQAALAQHLDKIVTFAAQKGIRLDSPEGIGSAMKQAGDSIRSHYYEKILGPVKAINMDISAIPGYSGKISTPSTATLADLDSRLSQINAELDPKFSKGGIAGQAAVKSAGDLNAEASAIRSVLYPRLGQATGLDPLVIARTREAFGSLRRLAEQTNSAASKGRFSANKAANAPITVNPFSASQGKQFIADKAVNAIRGDPVAKAIQKAISKGDIPRYQLPDPSPVAVRGATRKSPIRGESQPLGKVTGTSPEEVAAHLEKLQSRTAEVLKGRHKVLRRPIWEKMGNEPLAKEGP
jgi:hypothetical protein